MSIIPAILIILNINVKLLWAQDLPTAYEIKTMESQTVESPTACDLSEIREQIVQQSKEFSQEMRQIKREIALLRQSMEKPGLKEIFSGIGYILGLFGIAFYFGSKKNRDRSKCT